MARVPDVPVRGSAYLESLRDGRDVWVLGVGAIDDVTTHPVTAPVAREYAAWYDRHRDPTWRGLLMRAPRKPWAYEIPTTSKELRAMGAAIQEVALESGGNLTHTPGYGALIALGAAQAAAAVAPDRAAAAMRFRNALARNGRFVTFSAGGPPAADKFRTPARSGAARVVKRTRSGIVVDGVVGVHTAVPFAHDVLVLGRHPQGPSRWAWFVVPVAAPGVRVVARAPAARASEASAAPMSARFDELDAMLWLDNVAIPDERVFALGAACDQHGRDQVVAWLLWHQTRGWLARAEFSLGLGFALVEVMRLDAPEVLEALTDIVIDVETIRACITAAELDPERLAGGRALPRRLHLAPAALHALATRRRVDEALRRIAGAPALIAPTELDLADARLAARLERAFGGGDYSTRERAALLGLAWDHLAGALAAREASFEMFASGGAGAWRGRLRRWFDRGGRLSAKVLATVGVTRRRGDGPRRAR